MSKKDNVVAEEAEVIENNVRKNGEIPSQEDVIQTLKMQLEEHLKQAEYHKTMGLKAQGALEVLIQLNPEEQEKETK